MAKIVTQLSVHMENRPGALAELTGELLDAGVNIQAISVPDTGEFGTVRLVPDSDKLLEAREALEEAGHAHAAVDVLEVELPHRPGVLMEMARILADNNLTIRYAYATNSSGAESGLCILHVDDIHKAKDLLTRKLT
jgi:hypothetical protein